MSPASRQPPSSGSETALTDREGDASALLPLEGVQGDAASLSDEQARFNRLLAQVQGLRARVEQWQAADLRLQRERLGVLIPLAQQAQNAERQLVLTIDQLLQNAAGAALKPAERRRLTDALEQRLFALLNEDPDEDALIAVHDRWSHRPWAEERRLEALHDLAHLEEVFGVQVNPHEHDSPEEALAATMATLRNQAQAQFAQEEAQWAAREAKREAKRQARQQAKGEGGASAAPEAAQAVNQSLREIYRKLASALHPDRASDEADRARRHALMQKVNQANDAKDLLTLLQLQLEWAATEGGVGALADERLAAYSAVLKEQVTSLQAELKSLMAPFEAYMPARKPLRQWQPEMAWPHLAQEQAALQAWLQQAQADAQALLDPLSRKLTLKRWRQNAA